MNTPRTDALFDRHCKEVADNLPKFEAEIRGASELALRQVKELLEHARALERELQFCEECLADAEDSNSDKLQETFNRGLMQGRFEAEHRERNAL